MAKKIKRGGPRKNAGRKPGTDNKIPVVLYVKQSTIKILGDVDTVKYIAYLAIDNELTT